MKGRHEGTFQVHGKSDLGGLASIVQPKPVQIMLKYGMVASSN